MSFKQKAMAPHQEIVIWQVYLNNNHNQNNVNIKRWIIEEKQVSRCPIAIKEEKQQITTCLVDWGHGKAVQAVAA